jgi:myo-inositol-1(or 4)-monophosphatase
VNAGEDPSGSNLLGELLDVAVQTAQSGGTLLLQRFEQGRERGIWSKSTPTDLVSEADLVSQRAIRQLLAARRPRDGFLGEEEGELESGQPGAAGAPEPDRGAGPDRGLRWVVDPLDGTVNFVFGIPQWCVSVAVQDGAHTLAGAIFDPCREETWAATRGGEATLNGTPISSSERSELSTAMIATGLVYDAAVRAEQGRVLARLVPRVRDIRRFGSAALDLAWTAASRFDAYFERGVKLWDVAAGALICEQAGLEVVDLPAHGGAERLPAGLLVAPKALTGPLEELVA